MELTLKILFFVGLAVIIYAAMEIAWKFKRSIKEGDVNTTALMARTTPFITNRTKNKLILRALDNQDALERERSKKLAIERRRDVIQLFKKIPGVEITQTGLDEE